MKNPVKPQWIPYVTLCAGILGAALQVLFFATAVDAKGLLVSNHFADILCWIIAAVMLLFLALGIRRLGGIPKYEKLFPASLPGAIGSWIGAVGIAIASIRIFLAHTEIISIGTGVLGFASALCLVALGYWRWKGQKPPVLIRLPLILFSMLHLICQYRGWSNATQLQEYAFPLFASVFLLLSNYQRTALETKLGGRRNYVFCTQSAAFFSFLAAAQDPLFYLPVAVWMYLDICSLRLMQRKVKPAAEQISEPAPTEENTPEGE